MESTPKLITHLTAGICYEPVCTGRIDGVYPDTTHACRRSYTCRSGRLLSLDNCPYGKLHNGHACAAQDDVTCEQPQTTAIAYPYSGDRRCIGRNDGNHVAEHTNCSRYIVCDSAEVMDDIGCADGYRYSAASRQCQPKAEAGPCDSVDAQLCSRLRSGLNADPTSADCQSFIKCAGGKFIQREYCANQAVFNGHECVPRPLFECAPATNVPAHLAGGTIAATDAICRQQRNEGLSTADPRRGCQAYARCVAGRATDLRSCSPDQYFDPDKRRCMTNHRRQQCRAVQPPSSECVHLATGYYPDKTPDSSCRTYFYCHNGMRTNYQCAAGKIFDGENCVPANAYVCPNLNPNSCHSKLDGYHKDELAGCRAYFYCSQGRKYRYLCRESEVFNGTMCVQRRPNETCQNMGACMGRTDGYYYDVESQCRKYFYCLKNEVVTRLTCSGSKVFNGHKCVMTAAGAGDDFQCPQAGDEAASQQINCVPRSRCAEQGKCKGNGFYADIESGCVNYYFCIANTRSTVLTCASGMVFNGEICVAQEQYTCPQYCSNDVIAGDC